MLISKLTTPTLTHRLLAMVAMVVLLAGKTLHVHQECSNCSGASDCSTADCSAADCSLEGGDHCAVDVAEQSPISCPFGCDHHLTDLESADEPVEDLPAPHEEHRCAVCSVLAAAPECPLVMGLPEWTTLVQPAVLAKVSLPDTVEGREIRLRGPPLA